MKIRALAIGAAALVLPFAAACGSSDSGSKTTKTTSASQTTDKSSTAGAPTDAEVSAGFVSGLGVPENVADCAAKTIRDKVSPQALKAMADGNVDEVPDDELVEVTKTIQDTIVECS